jgi:acetyl-CoA C-acetyltransferase
MMTDAFIYDTVRSPRGKGRKDGSLHEVTAARLSALVLNALKARNNLDGHAVEDVIWGNVTQVMEQGGCLARTAVLASDLDESIPGVSINRFCASGLAFRATRRMRWPSKARSAPRRPGTRAALPAR